MKIKELSLNEFKDFAKTSKYHNFRQTLEYALFKGETDYEYEMFGYVDDNDNIKAASLILFKLLDGYLYAYAPTGFMIDYNDITLLKNFTKDLTKYLKKESVTFLKINPRVPIYEIDYKNKTKNIIYENENVISNIKEAGFKLLDNSNNFSSILPKANAILDLSTTKFENYSKNTKNKIKKSIRKGLILETGDNNQIHLLNSFVHKKRGKNDLYYNEYFNIFRKVNGIDYFLVSIDFNEYIINCQKAYEKEKEYNTILSNKVFNKPSPKNINNKMNSDRTLLSYKNDISIATKHMNDLDKEYIAGCLAIKYEDTVSIIISGYDKKYANFAPNYFMFNEIIEFYKDKYHYLDLDGININFDSNDKYHGLNEFKLGFNPKIYEYVGEFDYVINKANYSYLNKKNYLNKENEE